MCILLILLMSVPADTAAEFAYRYIYLYLGEHWSFLIYYICTLRTQWWNQSFQLNKIIFYNNCYYSNTRYYMKALTTT